MSDHKAKIQGHLQIKFFEHLLVFCPFSSPAFFLASRPPRYFPYFSPQLKNALEKAPRCSSSTYLSIARYFRLQYDYKSWQQCFVLLQVFSAAQNALEKHLAAQVPQFFQELATFASRMIIKVGNRALFTSTPYISESLHVQTNFFFIGLVVWPYPRCCLQGLGYHLSEFGDSSIHLNSQN